jgi:hypothetical protein
MTNCRRNRAPGGTFFFTVAIAERNLDLLVRHIGRKRPASGILLCPKSSSLSNFRAHSTQEPPTLTGAGSMMV